MNKKVKCVSLVCTCTDGRGGDYYLSHWIKYTHVIVALIYVIHILGHMHCVYWWRGSIYISINLMIVIWFIKTILNMRLNLCLMCAHEELCVQTKNKYIIISMGRLIDNWQPKRGKKKSTIKTKQQYWQQGGIPRQGSFILHLSCWYGWYLMELLYYLIDFHRCFCGHCRSFLFQFFLCYARCL